MALEEWKLRLTSAKVEVEVEAELGNNWFYHFSDTSIIYYRLQFFVISGVSQLLIIRSLKLHICLRCSYYRVSQKE